MQLGLSQGLSLALCAQAMQLLLGLSMALCAQAVQLWLTGWLAA